MRIKRAERWPAIWVETMLDLLDEGKTYAQAAEDMTKRFGAPFTRVMLIDMVFRLRQQGILEHDYTPAHCREGAA